MQRATHTLPWAALGLVVSAGCATIVGLDEDFSVGGRAAGTAAGGSGTGTVSDAGGAGAQPDAGGAGAQPDGGGWASWAQRRQLTIANPTAAAFTDFPLLVVLNPDRIEYSVAQDAGQDLRFVDDDGTTVLAHEIEDWNAGGVSHVWVKVPHLDASSATDHIWMYYGNPDAPDGQAVPAVWDSGYVGVWHLNQLPPQMRDSTSHGNHGTCLGNMTAADQVSGPVGGSLELDGTDDHVNVGSDPSLQLSGSLTIEAWLRTSTSDEQGVVGAYQALFPNNGYGLEAFGTMRAVFNWIETPSSDTAIDDSFPHHVAVTFNGASVRFYLDGAPDGEHVGEAPVPSNEDVLIGSLNDAPTGWAFLGNMDEPRISNTARSAEWIAMQYWSMTDTLVSYAPEMAP